MKLSLDWLSDWLSIEETPEEIAESLTSVGLAVDSVERRGADLAGVKIGRVDEVKRHPNADRLSLCKVFDGAETVSVVCGAPNVTAGGVHPFAPVGAKLPGGVEIRRVKIRGERSAGMLCSAKELGLAEDATGLMVLDSTLVPGTPLPEALGLNDTVLELDVPYNRPDWLGVRGVARELAARLGCSVEATSARPRESTARASELVRITLDDPEGCPLYGARIVRGVRVGPSPAWLVRRLEAIGQRAISNVVDVTNYVLHTYAQPIHAFDLDTLRGGQIRVRRAAAGESLLTLDGRSRSLRPDVLVIADAERSVAVAGIMGGRDTEVGEETTNLLLEAAFFDPGRVRRGVEALGLETDASMRFSRGVDPEGVLVALDHTARWIQEVAGGEVMAGRVTSGAPPRRDGRLSVRHQRIAHLLGKPIDPAETIDILHRLGFEPATEPERVGVTVPSWRADVVREEDLVEEVARFHGYDRFDARAYNLGAVSSEREPTSMLVDRSATVLVGLGFQEAVTPALTRRETAERSRRWTWAGGEVVGLVNARSEDTNTLRTSLLPGLLDVLRHNLHHGLGRGRFFEHDKVFAVGPGGLSPRAERQELACVLAEPPVERTWSGRRATFDLFSLKGLLEAWLRSLKLGPLEVAPHTGEPLAPGEAFSLQSPSVRAIGGRLDPAIGASLDLPAHVWLIAVDLEALLALTSPVPWYKETSRFPQVKRDLAFVVSTDVTHADVLGEVRAAAGRLLEDVRLFDVYEGPQVPPGRKSLAYALVFQSETRSLESTEVDDQVREIVARVSRACGATLRES